MSKAGMASVLFVVIMCCIASGSPWREGPEPSRIVPHLRPLPSHLVLDFLADDTNHTPAYGYVVAYSYGGNEEHSRLMAGVLPMCTLYEGVLCDMFYTERRTLGDNRELIHAKYVGPVAMRAPLLQKEETDLLSKPLSGDQSRRAPVVRGWETLALSGVEKSELEREIDIVPYYYFPENGVYRFKVNTLLTFLMTDGTMEERELLGNTRSVMVDNAHLQMMPEIGAHLRSDAALDGDADNGVTWFSCSDIEKKTVIRAIEEAKKAIKRAMEAIEHSFEHDSALERYFGHLTLERKESLLEAYQAALNTNVKNVRCLSDACSSHTMGYVYPWDESHSLFFCSRALEWESHMLGEASLSSREGGCNEEEVDSLFAAVIGMLGMFEDSAALTPMLPGNAGAINLARRHADLTTEAADNFAYFAASLERS